MIYHKSDGVAVAALLESGYLWMESDYSKRDRRFMSMGSRLENFLLIFLTANRVYRQS
ncbi:MAG: hypothetical protein WA949_17330 [Phormidesmis sp.]